MLNNVNFFLEKSRRLEDRRVESELPGQIKKGEALQRLQTE